MNAILFMSPQGSPAECHAQRLRSLAAFVESPVASLFSDFEVGFVVHANTMEIPSSALAGNGIERVTEQAHKVLDAARRFISIQDAYPSLLWDYEPNDTNAGPSYSDRRPHIPLYSPDDAADAQAFAAASLEAIRGVMPDSTVHAYTYGASNFAPDSDAISRVHASASVFNHFEHIAMNCYATDHRGTTHVDEYVRLTTWHHLYLSVFGYRVVPLLSPAEFIREDLADKPPVVQGPLPPHVQRGQGRFIRAAQPSTIAFWWQPHHDKHWAEMGEFVAAVRGEE